ncbi:endonuclease/exonuclease/phosphatase family protein [Novosphingobium sp. 9U]|uniref:endonuclease/exonuclease/phosphatase family protein n=1 Tax=Novosphingobium sp. 9U TaxID=2653158 RepID=UPI00135BB7C5|nr:endonuclease/exonuclease/phosphatase family protein [Novosphingobium sp. 9U]
MAAAAASAVVLVGQLGRTHHTLDQFNVMLPLLLPVLALCLAGALRLRDQPSIAVAAIGLLVGGYQLGGAVLAGFGRVGESAVGAGLQVKVLTLSTFHANPDPGAIAAVVNSEAPDIALLQETNGTVAPFLAALLPGYHRIKSCGGGGPCSLTILSRWPIERVPVTWPPHASHADLLLGEIQTPGGPLRVIDVHMARPYVKFAQHYMQQAAELARAEAKMPLVVGGDFNAGTGTFGLARFAQTSGLRRHDSFIPTYPANRPAPAFTGIDHVFASKHWLREGCHRTSAGHSDHYGVICRLRLRTGS